MLFLAASTCERPAPSPQPDATDPETPELRDFSRTVAHIDWPLLILVLGYHG